MLCFSEHIDSDQKSVIYFKLFDFDNDEKITKNDIETYLCNLSKSPEELIDIPLREYNNDTVTNKENELSQMELPNTIKEAKQERQQSDADLLTLIENKKKKEDEQKDTVINVNNNTNINDNINEEEQTLYNKIAEVIINESVSSNKDYLSYTDFKYMFIGSQYIKDYTHNLYFYDD